MGIYAVDGTIYPTSLSTDENPIERIKPRAAPSGNELGLIGTILRGQSVNYTVLRGLTVGHKARYYLCRDETGKLYFCMVVKPGDKEALMDSYMALVEAAEQARNVRELASLENIYQALGFVGQMRASSLRRYVEVWLRGRELEGLAPARAEENGEQEVPIDRPEQVAHFERYFPFVVERLLYDDPWQEGVQWPIMILDIVQDYELMIPLRQIIDQKRRVDLPTSAWVVEQMLELLIFYRYQVYDINGFLIDPINHELVHLDWMGSWASGEPAFDTAYRNVQLTALIGLQLIGAIKDTSGEEVEYRYPYEMKASEKGYLELLSKMTRPDGRSANVALSAHELFYSKVKEIWPMTFYPFKSYPLGEKQKEESS